MTLEHDLATKVGEVDFPSFDADCLVWVIRTELLCPSPGVLYERFAESGSVAWLVAVLWR